MNLRPSMSLKQSPAAPTAPVATLSLHYAELTMRGQCIGRSGEVLQAHTRWVAFEDLAAWPAALAANVDPRDVVRVRFPNDSTKRPAGVEVEVFLSAPQARVPS